MNRGTDARLRKLEQRGSAGLVWFVWGGYVGTGPAECERGMADSNRQWPSAAGR